MKLADMIIKEIKKAVELDGYNFHELFLDNGEIHVTTGDSDNRITLNITDYIYTIEV